MTSAMLKLWQLISPTLPVGAYSYSQGLELVIEAGWARNEGALLAWIAGLLHHNLGFTDLPVLARVHGAWSENDTAAVQRWSRELAAMRETAELRLEDSAMGHALARLVTSLGTTFPAAPAGLPFPCAFAVACAAWRVPVEDAAHGYAWAWCEAQVAAAVKLVPLGHTAGQRMLLALGTKIPGVVGAALALDDAELGASLPGFALASALHETQYTRLFRS